MSKLKGREALRAAVRKVDWYEVEISTGTLRLRPLTNDELLSMLAKYPEVVGMLAGAIEKGEFSLSDVIGVVAPRIVEGISVAVATAMEDVGPDEVQAVAADLLKLPNDDSKALRQALFQHQAPEGFEAFFDQFLSHLGVDGLVALVAQQETETPPPAA